LAQCTFAQPNRLIENVKYQKALMLQKLFEKQLAEH